MTGQNFRIISVSIFIFFIICMYGIDAWSKDKYPAKAIDLVLPVEPGAGADLMARILADGLKKELRQPINVINRNPAGGLPAVESVVKAAPDGYTLLGELQSHSSGKVVIKGWPFKLEDRTYIARMTAIPMLFIARGDMPWKSLTDFKNALQGPDVGKLVWASIKPGSTGDYAMYQFFNAIGFDHSKVKVVQYQSSNPASTAVAGKNGDFSAVNVGTSLPFYKAGKIRILAVTSPNRISLLPDIPTTKEQGYPGVDAMIWLGLSGPVGLDSEVVEILNNALQKILKDPKIIEALARIEATQAYLGPSEFKASVYSDADKVKKLFGGM